MILDYMKMTISDSDRKRINNYIKENELEYDITDNKILRYNVAAYDGMLFYIHKIEEDYFIVKYDKQKELMNEQAYFYYKFKNIQQVLEQLKLYDDAITKTWWTTPKEFSSGAVSFDKEYYYDNWHNNIFTNENWKMTEDEDYQYVIYEENKQINVISPFNRLHETGYYERTHTTLDRLYMEIHPLFLKEDNERFLIKILINNEEIMKEFINYNVRKKKGLKLFLENLFSGNNLNVKIIK